MEIYFLADQQQDPMRISENRMSTVRKIKLLKLIPKQIKLDAVAE